jgi:hypothetical protein
MSYAWHQLQYAVRALAGKGTQRERLGCAFYRLVRLRARDLPSEAAGDFIRLTGGIARYPQKDLRQAVKCWLASFSEEEVGRAIALIRAIHDAVGVYQPASTSVAPVTGSSMQSSTALRSCATL